MSDIKIHSKSNGVNDFFTPQQLTAQEQQRQGLVVSKINKELLGVTRASLVAATGCALLGYIFATDYLGSKNSWTNCAIESVTAVVAGYGIGKISSFQQRIFMGLPWISAFNGRLAAIGSSIALNTFKYLTTNDDHFLVAAISHLVIGALMTLYPLCRSSIKLTSAPLAPVDLTAILRVHPNILRRLGLPLPQ